MFGTCGSPGGVTSVVVNENRGDRAEDVISSMANCPPQKDASTNHIGDVSATCSDKSSDKSNLLVLTLELLIACLTLIMWEAYCLHSRCPR